MRMNRKAALGASVSMVALLAACSDSATEPTVARTLSRPSMVVSAPVPPVIGQITVCKVWDGTAGGATTIAAAVSADRGALGNSTIVGDNSFNNAECTLRATTTQGSDFFDDVTVTETVPAGAELTLVQRFDVGGPAGGTVVANGVAIGFNVFHGTVVVFTNRLLPPPPPPGCTYTKGWYRNNGSETVIAVDGRTKAQAQAIFAATPGKPGDVTWQGGNDVLNLYQQLLAALNNLGGDANEDNGPAAVDAAIDAAQNGTGGTGLAITTTLTQQQVSDLIDVLSDFNEGTFTGWPHCDD